jgi:hypothetical protein
VTIQSSITGILWLPDLQTYDFHVFLPCNQLLQRLLGDPSKEIGRECTIEIDCVLYVAGCSYHRTLERQVVVRFGRQQTVQTFSFILNELYEDFTFLPSSSRSDGSCYLQCTLGVKGMNFREAPIVSIWIHANKQDSFFVCPAPVFPNPEIRPYHSKFCEHFPGIIFEPDQDITTALIVINPNDRVTRSTVRLFPTQPKEKSPPVALELPPHTAKVLPLHEAFSPDGLERNAGILVLSENQQVLFAAHMDKSGGNVYSLEHLDRWRIDEYSKIPLTLYWRRKVARTLDKLGICNYHGR